MSAPILKPKPSRKLPPISSNTNIADLVNSSKFSGQTETPDFSSLSSSLQDLNNSSAEPTEPTASDSNNDPNKVTLTAAELDKIATDKASAMLSSYTVELQTKVDQQTQESARAVENLQLQLKQAQQDALASSAEVDRLKQVFKVSGYTQPNTKPAGGNIGTPGQSASPYAGIGFNITGRPSENPLGSALDLCNILDSSQYTPRVTKTGQDGESYQFSDWTKATEFYRANSAHLQRDMEMFARGNGLLNGGMTANPSSNSSVAGSTSITTIPAAFLDYLSMVQRETHSPQFPWWQFTSNKYEIGNVPGTTALVPRFAYIDEATSEEDYTLDTTEFSTPISAENQALQLLTSPLTLKGYGLGKGNKNSNKPVAVPEFINASSMIDLMTAIDSRLWQNYCSFEDNAIRKRYFEVVALNPDLVYYNNAGVAVNDPTSIGVGGDGTLSEDFLHSAFSEMANRNMLMFPSGEYAICVTPNQANQIRRSLDNKEQVFSEQQLMEITAILKVAAIGTGQMKPTGFIGRYCGFMVFCGTSWGQGLTPNNNGVASVTFGGAIGAKIVRKAYAFGMGAVGRGISMPFEIRQDGSGQFGTKLRFIWRSIESFGSLDVANNGTNGQQDRVLELRSVDQPL